MTAPHALRAAALTLLKSLHAARELEQAAEAGLRQIWPDVQGIRAVADEVVQDATALIDIALAAGAGLASHWLHERSHATGKVGVIIHDAGRPTERTWDITAIEDFGRYLAAEYPIEGAEAEQP